MPFDWKKYYNNYYNAKKIFGPDSAFAYYQTIDQIEDLRELHLIAALPSLSYATPPQELPRQFTKYLESPALKMDCNNLTKLLKKLTIPQNYDYQNETPVNIASKSRKIP